MKTCQMVLMNYKFTQVPKVCTTVEYAFTLELI